MAKKIKFYSKEEETTLQAEINAGVSSTKIAKKYAKLWKRTLGSLTVKVCKMMREKNPGAKRKIGRPVGSKTQKPANVISQGGVTLRNGFVFDFKPQRAEMFQDHVRIYF